MTETLLAPTFLFRFSVPCLYFDGKWTAGGVELSEEYRLPCFAELEGARVFGEVRAGWNEGGLFFTARVEGKRQTPWCRDSRIEDSDGLRVWIDTRDTHNIHRASRHCHSFAALPGGSGRGLAEPTADQLIINRARENAKPIRPGDLHVAAEKRVDGYLVRQRSKIPPQRAKCWRSGC